ncbi:MAG: MFS transporter, partial [Planctomycetota bacterium]
SRYTYRGHILADALSNLFVGMFGMNEIVARKTLGAGDLEIIVLVTAGSAFSVFAFLWGYWMQGREKTPFLLVAGAAGRGALLLTPLVSDSWVFVGLCCVVFMADPVILPAWNSVMQANYDPDWRGRLIGRVALWTRGLIAVAALGTGALLDWNAGLYRVIFPVAGVLGFLSTLAMTRVRVRRRPEDDGAGARPRSLGAVLGEFRRILRENPSFAAYERNFFLYGIAFMVVLPANVFLFVDVLKMSYSQASVAKLVVFQIAFALAAPAAGVLFDRWKTVRSAAISFTVLSLYPLALLAAWHFRSLALVYLAFVFFGVAMSAVAQNWSLGAMHFSGRQDASLFMGLHVTAVGVRGLFGPLIGYVVLRWFDLGAVYALSAAFFLIAAWSMWNLAKREEEGGKVSESGIRKKRGAYSV